MANEKDSNDFLSLGPELSNGMRPFVRHHDDCSISSGLSRVLKDGDSIEGYDSVLRLTPDKDGQTYSVKTLYEGSKGPAKVNSPRYKQGWDSIFGKTTVGSA